MRQTLKAFFIIVALNLGITWLAIKGDAMGITKDSIIMLYILGVLLSSVFTRKYFYGVVSAILYAASFNYFFTLPTYSLKMSSSNDIMLIAFFLGTAITGSTIMSRLTRQMLLAARNEATALMLYDITKKFVHITGKKNIIMSGINYVQQNSPCTAAVRLDGDGEKYDGAVGIASTEMPYEYPIVSTAGTIGALYINCKNAEVKAKDELLYRAAATQIGVALDREDLYNERENIRISMETEKNRSTFLRAVAHDIRTPLTSISGASTLLAEQFDQLSAEEKKKLAADISEETLWLTNLVENILNMTRIGESRLAVKKDYEVIDDVVAEALKHMERLWGGRKVAVNYPNDVVALYIDAQLIAQVLINLFDNAVKNTAPNDTISLAIEVDGQNAIFTVANTGTSIPDADKQSIFDAFFTRNKISTDSRRGVGLGLPICRAIVAAHGGQIWAEDNKPTGAKFIFTLPMED